MEHSSTLPRPHRPAITIATLPRRPVPAMLLAPLLLLAGTGLAQALDPFAPTINDSVRAVAVQPGGQLVIGGDFTQVGGQPRPHLARLNPDGSLAAVPAQPDDRVEAIAVMADGRIVIGGNFSNLGGISQRYVARLLANGQRDPGFQPAIGHSAGLRVTHLAVQGDGKVVIAGGFDTVGGQPRPGLARLHADGSLDTAFNPPPDLGGIIDALALQPDGRVLLAGPLDEIDAACLGSCVLRLTASGSPDAGFGVVNVVGLVSHLALQADGRILVGGDFGGLGDHDTFFVGRLNAQGTPDTGFANTAMRYSHITQIVPLPGGQTLIAGEIRWGSTGPTADSIARLLPGGLRDTAFAEPQLNNLIIASALQPDLRLLVAGMFTQVNGQARTRLARLRVADLPDQVFSNGFE